MQILWKQFSFSVPISPEWMHASSIQCTVKHGFLKHPIFKWELRLQLPLGNAFSINLLKILLFVVFLLSSCILCLGQYDYCFCIMKYRDQIPQYTRISIWSKLHIINSYYVITRKYTVLYRYYAGRSTNRVVLILLSLKYTWQVF